MLNALKFVELMNTVWLVMLTCAWVMVKLPFSAIVPGKLMVPFSVLNVTLVRLTLPFELIVIQFALLLKVVFVMFTEAFCTTSAKESALARKVTFVTVIFVVLVKLKPGLFELPLMKTQFAKVMLFLPIALIAKFCTPPAVFQVITFP